MGNQNKIEIYQSNDNQTEIAVHFDEETVWLTQAQMAELFDRNRVAITQHIGNIFKEGELDKNKVCKDFLHTTQHGAVKGKTQTTKTKYYNLDVIISVGYRVKSKQGTQFRQWATQRLKDYLVKGYAINEKRLEQKQQEVLHLKTGIQILSRAIEAQISLRQTNVMRYLDSKNDVIFKKIFGQHPELEKKEFWKMYFGLRFGFFQTTRKDWLRRTHVSCGSGGFTLNTGH